MRGEEFLLQCSKSAVAFFFFSLLLLFLACVGLRTHARFDGTGLGKPARTQAGGVKSSLLDLRLKGT